MATCQVASTGLQKLRLERNNHADLVIDYRNLAISTLHSESCQCLALVTIGILVETFTLGCSLCSGGLSSSPLGLTAHCCRKTRKCLSNIADMRDTMQDYIMC